MLHCCLCLLPGTFPVFLQAIAGKIIQQLLVFLVALGFHRKIAVRIGAQIGISEFPQLLHFLLLLFFGLFLLSQISSTLQIIADNRTARLLLLQQFLKLCVKFWLRHMISFFFCQDFFQIHQSPFLIFSSPLGPASLIFYLF